MAHLVRSAKSGCDWTLNDLDSYHISLNLVDPLLFFGLQVGDVKASHGHVKEGKRGHTGGYGLSDTVLSKYAAANRPRPT